MAQFKRRIETVDAWQITQAMIANRGDIFKTGVINPTTGLPVRPEDEEQAINAGWPRIVYLYRDGSGELASPLVRVRVGDWLVQTGPGEFTVMRDARFTRTFEPV
jgi:hypothetical protein